MSSIVLESDLLQFLLIIIQDAIGENYEPNPAMRGSYERINEHSIVQAIKELFKVSSRAYNRRNVLQTVQEWGSQ
jgi:hypothetical protein